MHNFLPYIAKEAQQFSENIGIPDITKVREKELSKAQWKRRIKEAVEKKNEKELKERIMKLEKLEQMKEEKYEQKDYLKVLTMEEARTFFRLRSRVFKCKMNQSSERRNRESLWKCSGCGCVDSQSHIIHCVAYQDLRTGKNLDSDQDVARYFKEVLRIREKLDA